MYLFITYGYPGMRGVQTKALRLAQFLIKQGQKVKFYDDGDHKPLIEKGLNYENWDFDALYLSSQITFPSFTKAVIFTDLPTNRIGQLLIFLSAKSQEIPTVVVDNFYRESQLKDRVFSNVIKYADLVILNGLISPSFALPSHLKIIGPFISPPNPPKKVLNWFNSLKIKKNQKIILGAGYNKEVLREIEKLALKIRSKNTIILALGAISKTKRQGNILYLPFLDDQKVSDLLTLASLTISKYGFIQVCEALMAKVPVVVCGKMRGFKMNWLDPKIKDLIIEASNSDQLFKITKEIVNKGKIYQEFQEKLEKLNFASKNSLEITGKLLEKIKARKIQIPKKVVVSFDDQKSLKKLKAILDENPFVLPLIFSIPYLRPKEEQEKETDFLSFDPTKKDEILKWGFQIIYRSSLHSFHGGATLFPNFPEILNNLSQLLNQADKVIYCNQKVENFIKPLLKKKG